MKTFHLALCAGSLALAGGLAVAAQAAPGGKMGHDPFGNATITRAEAQAKAVAMFDRMDANRDGKIDKADRAARMAQRFDRIDANHDGMISRDEFAAAHAGPMAHEGKMGGDKMDGGKSSDETRAHGGHGRGMKAMMAMHRLGKMDANGDRVITRDEFVAGALARFDTADANRDGKLTSEERRSAMQRMHGRMMDHAGHPPMPQEGQ